MRLQTGDNRRGRISSDSTVSCAEPAISNTRCHRGDLGSSDEAGWISLQNRGSQLLSRAERYEQESRYRDRQLVGREEGDIRRVGGAVPVPEVAATLREQEKVRKYQQHCRWCCRSTRVVRESVQ